jgi:thioredoxin 1
MIMEIVMSEQNVQPVEVTEQNFETEVLKADHPVLVDFWAEWCGPCRTLGPVIESLAGQYGGKVSVAKIDVESNQQLAMQFGIRSIPTVMLFDNGQIVSNFVGVRPSGEYEKAIDAVLETSTA